MKATILFFNIYIASAISLFAQGYQGDLSTLKTDLQKLEKFVSEEELSEGAKLVKKLINTPIEVTSKDEAVYSDWLYLIGKSYYQRGIYIKAIIYLELACKYYDSRREKFVIDDKKNIDCLLITASMYKLWYNYDLADKFLVDAVNIGEANNWSGLNRFKKTVTKEREDIKARIAEANSEMYNSTTKYYNLRYRQLFRYYANCNNKVLSAAKNHVRGDFQIAGQLLDSFINESIGRNNLEYAIALQLRGTLRTSIGDYPKAKEDLEESLQIQNAIGSDKQFYAETLVSLGKFHSEVENWTLSVENYQNAIQAVKTTNYFLYKDIVELWKNDLALIYAYKGDIQASTNLLFEISNFFNNYLPDRDIEYCKFLRTTAVLHEINDNDASANVNYHKVEGLLQTVCRISSQEYLTIQLDLLRINTKVTLLSGNNRGLQYAASNARFSENIIFVNDDYQQDKAIRIAFTNDVSRFLLEKGNFFKVKQLQEQNLLSLGKQTYFQESYMLSSALLSQAYISLFEPANALKFLEPLRGSTNKILAGSHIDLLLLRAYTMTRQFDKAKKTFFMSYSDLNDNLTNKLLTGSYINQIHSREYDDELIRLGRSLTLINPDQDMLIWLCNHNMLMKGFETYSTKLLYETIRNSSDSAFKTALGEYIKKRDLLLMERKKVEDLNFLQIETYESRQLKTKEVELAIQKEKLLGFEGYSSLLSKSLSIGWNNLQGVLKENETVIDFVTIKDESNQEYFFAIVTKKQFYAPKLVKLCSVKTIEDIIESIKTTGNINDLYRGTKNNIDIFFDDKVLYKLLWKPIEDNVQLSENLFICPVGLLNRISFGTIISGKTSNALNIDYDLHHVGNIREILNKSKLPIFINKKSPTAIFGGIDYSAEREVHINQETEKNDVDTIIGALDSLSILLFNKKMFEKEKVVLYDFLPGTLKEVNNISPFFSNASTYTGKTGSEEKFKALSKTDIKLIHISTHGFYYPASDSDNLERLKRSLLFPLSPTNDISVNPEFRAGMVFSEANSTLSGIEDDVDKEDGLLTAAEIATLDLTGVDLVVLSGCETALGKIDNNEGVLGLQRAFKIAGAKHIIASLWKVPDQETTDFMVYFYTQLINFEKSINQSFKSTQEYMQQKFPNEPFKWAGFVLFE